MDTVTITFTDAPGCAVVLTYDSVICNRCGHRRPGGAVDSCCKLAQDLAPGDAYRFDDASGQIRLIDTVEVA